MDTPQTKETICQSCGMPMKKSESFGTNHDGSKSGDYCCACFKDGEFTAPDITADYMIWESIGIIRMEGASKAKQEEMRKLIPTLKRWQKK
jgi:hypothetical protein